MDELVASRCRTGRPRFTINGVTVADFERVTGGRGALGRTGAPPGRRSAPSTRSSAARPWPRAGIRSGGRAPRSGGGLLPLRQVRLRRRTSTRCAPRTRARSPASTTRCRTSTRPGERVEMPFEGSRLVGVLRRPVRQRSVPGRRPAPGSRLDQGGAPLDRGDRSSTAASRPSRSTAPARARRSTTSPSAATGRRSPRLCGRRWASCPRSTRSRLGVWGVSLGGYYAPRVAAALGDRATRLCRAGRPLQLRRVLARAAAADPATPSGCAPARPPMRRPARSP